MRSEAYTLTCVATEVLPPIDVETHIRAAVEHGADRAELEENVRALLPSTTKGIINLVSYTLTV